MIGEDVVLRASQWCYKGVWANVTKWLCVPDAPPELRGAHDANIRAFRPAEGYLRYRKLFFWIGLFVVDIALLIAWIALLVALPIVGLLLAPLFWIVIVVPDIVVYIGIHLVYDTTWYVLSDRTLRIRRGIWVINEVTITYENIQNVSIQQGPVQRYFGIGNVLVQTAGGGGIGPHGEKNMSAHLGLLEGIDNAAHVRELIMAKWRAARSAGLGDETHRPVPLATASMFEPEAERVLEEIRDLAVQLARSQ